MAKYGNIDGVSMKSKRTFWILPELSKRLDIISGPNGDGRTITWHLEQALKRYFDVKADNPKQEAVEPKKKSKRFIPPDREQAANYFFERGLTNAAAIAEGDKFIDFYQSKNWMVGKNKMKDWKAAIRNWMRKSDEKNNRPYQQRSSAVSRVREAGERKRAEIEARRSVLNNLGDTDGHVRTQDRVSVRGANAGGVEDAIEGSYTQTD